ARRGEQPWLPRDRRGGRRGRGRRGGAERGRDAAEGEGPATRHTLGSFNVTRRFSLSFVQVWLVPDGQVIRSDARFARPRPKWTTLSAPELTLVEPQKTSRVSFARPAVTTIRAPQPSRFEAVPTVFTSSHFLPLMVVPLLYRC